MVKPISNESALRDHLAAARAEREAAARFAVSAADRLAVRSWQQARLTQTHADFLASARYGPAAKFFVTELYSTKDLSQRDADIERVVKVLVKFLPDKALATLATALEMDALSELLDNRLAARLRDAQGNERPLRIDATAYQRAYCEAEDMTLRNRQFELTEEIGASLDTLTKVPLLQGLLRIMKRPAYASGVGQLHEFLDRGYAAFAHMKGGAEFVKTVVARERAEHQRLMG